MSDFRIHLFTPLDAAMIITKLLIILFLMWNVYFLMHVASATNLTISISLLIPKSHLLLPSVKVGLILKFQTIFLTQKIIFQFLDMIVFLEGVVYA